MPNCENCGCDPYGKRVRCQLCKRLCCVTCLDWSARNDYGRDGYLWCTSSSRSGANDECTRIARALEAGEPLPKATEKKGRGQPLPRSRSRSHPRPVKRKLATGAVAEVKHVPAGTAAARTRSPRVSLSETKR